MLGTQICWGFGFERDCWSVEVAEVAGSGGRHEMAEGEKKKQEKCQRRKRQGLRKKKRIMTFPALPHYAREKKKLEADIPPNECDAGELWSSFSFSRTCRWCRDGLGW